MGKVAWGCNCFHLSSERFPHVFQHEHQLKTVDRRGIEIEIFVKLSCLVVDRMHNSPDADDICGLLDAFECIEQESFPETFSLLPDVDG